MSQELIIERNEDGTISRISGEFSKQTNTNEAGDHFQPAPVVLTVPTYMAARVSVVLEVDDWGYVDIIPKDENTSPIRAVDLTEGVEPAGPRGGHIRWTGRTKDLGIDLLEGEYEIVVHQDNARYSDEYADKSNYNVSYCKVDIQVEYSDVAIEPDELNPKQAAQVLGQEELSRANCVGYIPTETIENKCGHTICVEMEYIDEGGFKEGNKGTPKSSVASDTFSPKYVETKQGSTTSFTLTATEDTSSERKVSLNRISSDSFSLLPAVFKKPFEVTLYYTVRESGCPGEKYEQEVKYKKGGVITDSVIIPLNPEFLLAVNVEGFGRLETPYTYEKTGETFSYIGVKKKSGNVVDHYFLAQAPVGNNSNVLRALVDCAAPMNILAEKSIIQLLLPDKLRNMVGADLVLEVTDVGGAVTDNHIDLYWGEDDPLDPHTEGGRYVPKTGKGWDAKKVTVLLIKEGIIPEKTA